MHNRANCQVHLDELDAGRGIEVVPVGVVGVAAEERRQIAGHVDDEEDDQEERRAM